MKSEAQSLVHAAYDEVATTYTDHYRSVDAETVLDKAILTQFVIEVDRSQRASSSAPLILDAGCGSGRLFPLLLEHHRASGQRRLEGVDLSPAMIALAQRDHPCVPSHVGSLTELPYADHSVDAILSWYSTIHSPDDELSTIFAEFGRTLRPGGVALVSFQAGTGQVRDIGAAFAPFGHDVTLYRYHRDPDVVANQLRNHGFEVIARLERAPQPAEADPQAALLVRNVN